MTDLRARARESDMAELKLRAAHEAVESKEAEVKAALRRAEVAEMRATRYHRTAVAGWLFAAFTFAVLVAALMGWAK